VIHLDIDKRQPKLESLTDEEWWEIGNATFEVTIRAARGVGAKAARTASYRAVVNAERERERAILAQETEEELLERISTGSHITRQMALAIIGVVRVYDRAKAPPTQCDCGRPLSPGKCGVCDNDD
jgi:hypothetical protein